ncbi:HlyD family efflux transporter periplasmic adaptor subunit [Hahella ganghwensis]|uniref:HlyD family efflux transporter periplasmic adaptor subunit n=1 Tax=Hahella ganghwensis TaxID=286420 RepID=UPI0012FAE356|nr:HlyD family efflux transporter periplasmic adaptor subunit [Hahella ganghwensis]
MSTEKHTTSAPGSQPIYADSIQESPRALSEYPDSRRYSRIGWMIVIAGFVGFVAWAALAPLDRGVVVEGAVTVAGNRKAVQHPSGGVIKNILIQEGDYVQQGQILVLMDSTVPQVKVQAAQSHYFTALATEARLMAEKEGLAEIDFPALLQNLEYAAPGKETQDSAALPSPSLATTIRQTQELQRQLFISRRQASYQQDLRTQLAEIRLDIESQRERKITAEQTLLQSRIIAPVAGRVVDLKVFTEGGVVSAAEKLMEIVPDNQPLLVEARLPLDVVDSMRLQQPVDLMFTAFNRSQTPKVTGKVVQLSADRLTDPATQQAYYGLKIEVTGSAMAELNGLKIIPGMPVQAFIRNGERSLLSYLFKPLLDRIPLAMAGEV